MKKLTSLEFIDLNKRVCDLTRRFCALEKALDQLDSRVAELTHKSVTHGYELERLADLTTHEETQ